MSQIYKYWALTVLYLTRKVCDFSVKSYVGQASASCIVCITAYKNLWNALSHFERRDCCMCRDLFPSSRCLFMYRDAVTVAKSLYRVSMVLPSLRLVMLLGYLSRHVSKAIGDSMGFSGSDFCVRMNNDLTLGVLLFAVTTSSYLDLRRRGFNVSALRYEDLVARPLEMCRVILEFCHLPVSLAKKAVKAFDTDSQKNSIVSRSSIGHFKAPQLTPQRKMKLNELLKKHGMPLIGEPGIIEGTLSWHS